jgi:hypothetical protein
MDCAICSEPYTDTHVCSKPESPKSSPSAPALIEKASRMQKDEALIASMKASDFDEYRQVKSSPSAPTAEIAKGRALRLCSGPHVMSELPSGWMACGNCAYEISREEFDKLVPTESPKAEAPPTLKEIAHRLWYEGGRLRTNLKASLDLHPEDWHVEAAEQRLAEWDKAAENYFDYAISGKPDPVEAETPPRDDGKIDELTGELISVKAERDQLRQLLMSKAPASESRSYYYDQTLKMARLAPVKAEAPLTSDEVTATAILDGKWPVEVHNGMPKNAIYVGTEAAAYLILKYSAPVEAEAPQATNEEKLNQPIIVNGDFV